jgi:hypothetical protein
MVSQFFALSNIYEIWIHQVKLLPGKNVNPNTYHIQKMSDMLDGT